MLKGINPVLTSDLLKILWDWMGTGPTERMFYRWMWLTERLVA